MKKFKTVKDGVCFILDYELTVEIIQKRRRSIEPLTDKYCCMYLDSLDACDLWDDFDSAVITHNDWSPTVVIED